MDASSALVVLGSALLGISLFLEWYERSLSAWEVFEALDLLLAGLAILAAVIALGRMDVAVPGARGWLPAAAGIAFVVVIVQLIDPPPVVADGDPQTGAWLALAAASLMLIGTAMAVARISIVLDVRDRDRDRTDHTQRMPPPGPPAP